MYDFKSNLYVRNAEYQNFYHCISIHIYIYIYYSLYINRCTDFNQTAEKITLTNGFQSSMLLPIFVALTALFLLMIAILSYYINKLRRRPRIKRHYVVSKGVTPLTSRPQVPDQCEITIENCCNMNICETVSDMSSK